jgi:hypothetical protein
MIVQRRTIISTMFENNKNYRGFNRIPRNSSNKPSFVGFGRKDDNKILYAAGKIRRLTFYSFMQHRGISLHWTGK